jgi:phosphoserine/homoserine phosphotransferase
LKYSLSTMSAIACLDLEGVLVPEIWINVARRTGIDALSATTRDIADYSELMRQRLDICEKNGLGISDISDVIAEMRPLQGATDFLAWLRENSQVVILSDTFYEFAKPLMRQLGFPTLFCHRLEIAAGGRITGFELRIPDQKREAVRALKNLNFRVVAAGDSYNDITMLGEADAGILFCPPAKVIDEFPQFPVTGDYSELRAAFEEVL